MGEPSTYVGIARKEAWKTSSAPQPGSLGDRIHLAIEKGCLDVQGVRTLEIIGVRKGG